VVCGQEGADRTTIKAKVRHAGTVLPASAAGAHIPGAIASDAIDESRKRESFFITDCLKCATISLPATL
jgi:hypothetical protein